MSAQAEALDRLIAAVEVGELTRPGNERHLAAMPQKTWEPIVRANSGSLDAAKALHDALLPGWMWEIDAIGEVWVWGADGSRFHTDRDDDKPSNTARAWLLAVLRAYRGTLV